MGLTLDQSRKVKSTGILLLFGALLGPFYVIFSDGFTSVFPYVNSTIAGILIAINIGFFEYVLFDGKIKQLPFYQIFSIRIILYVVSILSIILFVLIFSRMFKYDLNFYEVLISDEFQNYILYKDFKVVVFYALAIVALTNFTIQMNRKMGQGVLINLISGKYYQPKKVEKIVLFLKIQRTKELIEEVGRLNYHKFLKEVFYDLTEIVLLRKAQIYEYVEDQVVILWDVDKGMENANCIRAFFDIQQKLDTGKVRYYDKYKFLPEFVGAMHKGELIVGEIGDIKSEIKYHGDLMNTCYRILGNVDEGKQFLVSEELVNEMKLPIIFDKKRIGEFSLRGKQRPIILYQIVERKLDQL